MGWTPVEKPEWEWVAVDEIGALIDEETGAIKSTAKEEFALYIERMRQPEEYGENITLRVIGKKFKMKIGVVNERDDVDNKRVIRTLEWCSEETAVAYEEGLLVEGIILLRLRNWHYEMIYDADEDEDEVRGLHL